MVQQRPTTQGGARPPSPAPSQPSTGIAGTAPSALIPVKTSDAAALVGMVLGGREVTVEIPVTATLAQVEETLDLAVGGYKTLASATEQLKPIIGRILLTISERKLYRPHYKNFTQFLQQRVVDAMGFGRTNAFEALRIAKKFPNMSATEYQNYGATRLLYASAVTNESDPKHKEFLDASTRMNTDEFREHVKVVARELKGETTTDTMSVVLSLRVTASLKERFGAAALQAGYSASDLLGEMLDAWEEAHPPVEPSEGDESQQPS